ncbi:hypothetical protein A9G11_12865 [Gilliamella sp. wkB108]|uniref:hypothetical protein n=1 Tax=Gilliamella sp. wkB108 TaxID=3120256 RepID=UPI00080E9A28|nr:hypothetical protein [Gilliamella apicola]OCG27300.1 hypothetical protein A9G11_12865 [Gilliamella apicola]
MKKPLYIGVILFLFSFGCYGQEFIFTDNFEGSSILEKIDIWKLEKDCQKPHDFWQFTNSEREKSRERCQINQIAPNFDNLYEIINNEVVIYNQDNFKLVINKKIYDKTINNKKYPVKELSLSLIYKNNQKDKIILANSYYDVEGYYWLSNQYYYITPKGDIYLLLAKDIDTSVKPIFWKHYQIDKENSQFQLKELLVGEGYKYQIIYPNQFKMLKGSLEASRFNIDELKTCYQNEHNTICSLDSYRYYHDILSQKLVSLAEKNPTVNENIDIIDKEINQICLTSSPPIYHNQIEDFTFNITKCLTEKLNYKIEKIDKNE